MDAGDWPADDRPSLRRRRGAHASPGDSPTEVGIAQEGPRLEIADDSTISIRVVHALVRAIEQAGGSRAQLLRGSPIALDQHTSAEARVPRAEVTRLCELAMDLTNDPALGLHFAERVTQHTFGPVSHLIAHSKNLRQALESISQFHRLLSDGPSCQVVELGGRVTVQRVERVDESLRLQRFCSELMMVGIFRLIRSFAGHARSLDVSFAYPAPPYRSEYGRFFEQRERFEQPFTGFVFDRALLDAPSPYKDEEIHAALRALAERRLMRITQQTPYATRIREFLVCDEAWRDRSDMPSVARSLGLSVRSLRRRLAQEKTSYTAVTNEALAFVAMQFLRQQRTIQETAHEMGFADASSFHRAFKRWTGATPSAYREAQLDREARR